LPGLNKPSKITFKRGVDPSLDLWEWRKTTLDGQTSRRDGAVILLDEARKPVLRWEFRNGWVSKYDGPALNSKTSEVAIYTVEIVTEACFSEVAMSVYLTPGVYFERADARLAPSRCALTWPVLWVWPNAARCTGPNG